MQWIIATCYAKCHSYPRPYNTAYGTHSKLRMIADYGLFSVHFIKNEFPAFSMQGVYCGSLFRDPQRGVFCILPAVPSFLGSSVKIV